MKKDRPAIAGIGFYVWGKSHLYLKWHQRTWTENPKTEANIPPRIVIVPSTVWSVTNSVIASLVVLVPMGLLGHLSVTFSLLAGIKRTSIGTWSKFDMGGAITLAVQAGMEKPNPSTFMDIGAKAYYFIIG